MPQDSWEGERVSEGCGRAGDGWRGNSHVKSFAAESYAKKPEWSKIFESDRSVSPVLSFCGPCEHMVNGIVTSPSRSVGSVAPIRNPVAGAQAMLYRIQCKRWVMFCFENVTYGGGL